MRFLLRFFGFLFAAGAVAPLLGIAGSYALCAVLLCTIPLVWRSRVPPQGSDRGEDADGQERRGFLRSLGEGFRMVFADRILRGNMLCNAGLMIGVNMTVAVLVLYAQEDLGVPAALFGIFLLSLGAPTLLTALVVWGGLSRPTPPGGMAERHLALAQEAHGKDVVTVILADFRSLDTLVEITVVAVAMIALVTMLRGRVRA
jgi:hypothetical protein